MDRIESKIRTSSAEFQENLAHNRAAAEDLRKRLEHARRGGSEEHRKRHKKRGKLLPRERVDALLDPGTPFLELSPLAANDLYKGEAPAAGMVTGIAFSSGTSAVNAFCTSPVVTVWTRS